MCVVLLLIRCFSLACCKASQLDGRARSINRLASLQHQTPQTCLPFFASNSSGLQPTIAMDSHLPNCFAWRRPSKSRYDPPPVLRLFTSTAHRSRVPPSRFESSADIEFALFDLQVRGRRDGTGETGDVSGTGRQRESRTSFYSDGESLALGISKMWRVGPGGRWSEPKSVGSGGLFGGHTHVGFQVCNDMSLHMYPGRSPYAYIIYHD